MRKNKFKLYWPSGSEVPNVQISIDGQSPESDVTVSISAFSEPIHLSNKDLERFAINILKAIGSKHRPKKGGIEEEYYEMVHQWLRKSFGKAKICENPDCTCKNPKRFEWALRKGAKYEKILGNFIQLCAYCHRRYDDGPNKRKACSIGAINRKKTSAKPIEKLDIKTGRVVRVYRSVSRAAFDNNVSVSAVSLALTGGAKTCAGHKWRYCEKTIDKTKTRSTSKE